MKRKRVLVVDGYNIINARDEVLLTGSLADARDRLTAMLEDYAGYSGQTVLLVYDAWLSDRLQRTSEQKGPLTVVYTRHGETADHYIERFCDSCAADVAAGRIELRVATSDALEQTVVLGRGASRISAREIWQELSDARRQARETTTPPVSRKMSVADRLPGDVLRKLEEMRRGAEDKNAGNGRHGG